jgi:hypothetical protein
MPHTGSTNAWTVFLPRRRLFLEMACSSEQHSVIEKLPADSGNEVLHNADKLNLHTQLGLQIVWAAV